MYPQLFMGIMIESLLDHTMMGLTTAYGIFNLSIQLINLSKIEEVYLGFTTSKVFNTPSLWLIIITMTRQISN